MAPSSPARALLRAPILLAALLAGPPLLAAPQDGGGEPAPKAGDAKPPPPPPVDEGLDPEREILKEARSDPRNQKADAFPVIRRAAYAGALEAKRMDPEEWVIGTVVGNTTLAFPVNVLNHHEIVVDEVDGVPFLVCFCPLCRTGAVFSRVLDGEALDFGHSGLLYRSAFLLYDAPTRSLWHHALGRSLAGKMRGRRLERLPTWFVKWDVWRRARPETRVLAKDPQNLDYTADAYEARNLRLKLAYGLGISAGGEDRLYEFTELERLPLVQEPVGGVPVVVLWEGRTRTAAAFERRIDGKVLDLRRAEDGEGGLPRLEETGENRTVFDGITGLGLSGPLKGKSLRPVVQSWWEVYAWTAHHPRGTMYRASAPRPQELPEVPK
jgi:hypothetical protein